MKTVTVQIPEKQTPEQFTALLHSMIHGCQVVPDARATSDPEAVACSSCGCKGNRSCGHSTVPGRGCELGDNMVCPCCREKARRRRVS